MRRNLVLQGDVGRARVRLQGHEVASQEDLAGASAVDPSATLRLTFVLARPAEVQAAFTKLLADQQDPASPRFHQWLTPTEIGERYGPTEHDVAALADWLATQGLLVREVAPSGVFVQAEGPAGVIARALDTEIVSVGGSSAAGVAARIAVTREPAIPAGLGTLVRSIAGLAGEQASPLVNVSRAEAPAARASVVKPRVNGPPATHYIAPDDFAHIYGITSVYNSGIDGTGQSIAIVGRSRVLDADITNFAKFSARPAKLPNVIVPASGSDPGMTADGDQTEATLDVERVLGTAPGAHIDLVISARQTGGIQTAAQYEVQTLRDPVMSVSFGLCEGSGGLSSVSFWDALFSQAAAEGISAFVASGDAGSAGCAKQLSTPSAGQSRSINALCASANVTCVGGTELADFATQSTYWYTSQTAAYESATGYIPEGAWNEPARTDSTGAVTYFNAASGGGASTYIAKPVWQAGPGVPNDGYRDVPDVSFSSAMHDGYLGCLTFAGYDCVKQWVVFSGTSAATPSMAAIAAMLNQKMGSAQGNLNPLLYKLWRSTLNAYPWATPFHDVMPETSGVALCDVGTPSMCNNSTPAPGALTGGLAGYPITPGYDLATGLGSIDAANLFAAAAPSPKSLQPVMLWIFCDSIYLNVSQTTSCSGTANSPGAPADSITGTIQFYVNGAATGSPVAVSFMPSISDLIGFPTVGTYTISATYSGDSNYATATSASVSVRVVPDPAGTSRTTLTMASSSVALGGEDAFTVTVTATSPSTYVPGGKVQFYQGTRRIWGPFDLLGGTRTTTVVSSAAIIGSEPITAVYLGDAEFRGSTSASLPFTVTKGQPTLVVTPLYSTVATGVAEAYSVAVSYSAPTAPVPTGTVELFRGGASIGSVALVNGKATFVGGSQTSVGTYGLSAVYSGDANFLGATSSAAAVTVSADPPYQLSSSTAGIAIAAGATTSNGVLINLPGTSHFVGNVNLACKVTYLGTGSANLPPTCTFMSNYIPFPNGPTSSLLVFSSTAPASGSALNKGGVPGPKAPLLVLCPVVLFVLVPRFRGSVRVCWVVLAMFVVSLAGCGGGVSGGTTGGGGGSAPAPAATGTTPGNYLVTVTASNTAGVADPPPVTISLTVR